MIKVNKTISVTIAVHNGVEVAKSKAGFFKRLGMTLTSDNKIKGDVDTSIEEAVKHKLEMELPLMVEAKIKEELEALGIQADVKVR